jgi:ribosomal protein S18 acetylase RimI-like enzyme
LQDTIAQMHAQNKSVTLSVGLKNHGAYRLYQRLGFREVARSDTHFHMSCDPHPSNQLTDHKP